jgi:PR domain zinc finger protein 13
MKYCCHHCCRVYENPNPLKLHLARNCDQLDENVIWKRLQAELLSRHQRKLMIHSRNFEMLNPFSHHHHHHLNGVPILPSSSSHNRLSAFQPVTQNIQQSCRTTPSPPIAIPNLSTISQGSVSESALAAAAHLETIVSNMGTSKQGHLCIYCGKLYSRKYGELQIILLSNAQVN